MRRHDGPIASKFILKDKHRHGPNYIYRQVSNISRALVAIKIVDHSDVVGAGDAPTTSSFST